MGIMNFSLPFSASNAPSYSVVEIQVGTRKEKCISQRNFCWKIAAQHANEKNILGGKIAGQ
jgi:hypothetical protein